MHRKRFYVRMILELHAITCPGVWLCTHGYLEATLKTLGYYFRTNAMEPRFPLLCHDVFVIEGYFKAVETMTQLERIIAAENVELTLWQHGRRLAYFSGKLADFLQSGGAPRLSCPHNINVQVLLKPTTAFPGILAPKAELSAEIGVQDRFAETISCHSRESSSRSRRRCTKHCHGPAHFITPNLTGHNGVVVNRHRLIENSLERNQRSCSDLLDRPRRQRSVCHARQLENDNDADTGACCAPDHGRRESLDSSCFRADVLLHQNADRRLSSCSSAGSSNPYTLSQLTRCSSCCSHASDTTTLTTMGMCPEDSRQRACHICQSYAKTFL